MPEVAEHLDGVEPIDKVVLLAPPRPTASTSQRARPGAALRDRVARLRLQTAHDLLDRGVEVHVARDAVTSRTEENRELGLHKMEGAGAVVTSVETALFELLGAAGTRRVQGKCRRWSSEPRPTLPLRAARGRHALRRRRGRRRRGRTALGEVVFNTAMTGYQEAVTDPSYARPDHRLHLPADRQLRRRGGAHGVRPRPRARGDHARGRSTARTRPHAEGGWLTWLRDCGIPALTGVDTRALVRHIRDKGAMRGGVFDAGVPEAEARDADRRGAADGRPRPRARGHAARAAGRSRAATARSCVGARHGHQDARSCATCASAACGSTLLPVHDERRGAARARARRGLPRQRPGRPGRARLRRRTPCASWSARCRSSGICLGHQLLCRAVGLETFKLPFGHRGANHPVKDLETGKIEITAQNHGFAVLGPGGERTIDDDEPVRWETDFGAAELSQLNLYDRTVEGLVLHDVPAVASSTTPRRARARTTPCYLFDRFLELARCRVGAPTSSKILDHRLRARS